MKLIFEIWNRYLQLETGEIYQPVDDPEEEEEEEPGEFIRLPLGFQPPPEEQDDDSEPETQEIDCRRGPRG